MRERESGKGKVREEGRMGVTLRLWSWGPVLQDFVLLSCWDV